MPRVGFELSTRAHSTSVRQYIRDLNHVSEWGPEAVVQPDKLHHGAIMKSWGVNMTYTVERDVPDELRLKGEACVARTEEVYWYKTVGKVTHVTHTLDFYLEGWRWFLTPILYLQFRRQSDAAAKRLTERLLAIETIAFGM